MERLSAVLSANPLRVDVGDLVRRPGDSKPLEFETHIPDLAVGLGRVADGGAIWGDLLMEVLVEGILVTGRVSGEFEMECSRCLRPFTEPFTGTISEIFAYPDQPELAGLEPGDEDFVIEDDTIDLEPAIRDEILLSVPTNPLHAPDCKGLCAVCGQDLNVKDCGHAHEPVDIRWEPLKQLRKEIGD